VVDRRLGSEELRRPGGWEGRKIGSWIIFILATDTHGHAMKCVAHFMAEIFRPDDLSERVALTNVRACPVECGASSSGVSPCVSVANKNFITLRSLCALRLIKKKDIHGK